MKKLPDTKTVGELLDDILAYYKPELDVIQKSPENSRALVLNKSEGMT